MIICICNKVFPTFNIRREKLIGKKFKDLDLNNAFLFSASLSDSDTCKVVLEIILGKELPPVTVRTEHSILISSDFRMVRFDVYATDELQVSYNIESQNYNENNLALRSRFHQAELDVTSLKPGESFDKLRPVYVIFVCTFDPFGKGLYRYTFENTCNECGILLGDGAKRIFLNTKGRNANEVPKELIHFLNYMQHSTDDYVAEVNDTNISRIHERVKYVKRLQGMEDMYMTGAEWLEQCKAQGMAQGLEQGLAQGLTQGKAEDVITLLSEYGLVSEELKEKIMSECNIDILMNWVKLAAKVSSVDEFMERM